MEEIEGQMEEREEEMELCREGACWKGGRGDGGIGEEMRGEGVRIVQEVLGEGGPMIEDIEGDADITLGGFAGTGI